MGLARRVGDWWWLPAAPVFIGLTLLFAFVVPWLLGGTTYRSPDVRSLERIEHVRHVPVRVLDGFDEPNAFATGLGAEPARVPLAADRRAAVHAADAALRARPRARPPGARPHLEVGRLVRALHLPDRVPDRARDPAARRDGRARGRPARDLRARRAPAPAAAAPERGHAAHGGGGRLVGAPSDARPERRPAAVPACSRPRRSRTPTRPGGTTSSSRTTRRSCSGSR